MHESPTKDIYFGDTFSIPCSLPHFLASIYSLLEVVEKAVKERMKRKRGRGREN